MPYNCAPPIARTNSTNVKGSMLFDNSDNKKNNEQGDVSDRSNFPASIGLMLRNKRRTVSFETVDACVKRKLKEKRARKHVSHRAGKTFKYKMETLDSWIRDLTIDGDVESNPGYPYRSFVEVAYIIFFTDFIDDHFWDLFSIMNLYIGSFNETSWIRDLTIDGDVESNPGMEEDFGLNDLFCTRDDMFEFVYDIRFGICEVLNEKLPDEVVCRILDFMHPKFSFSTFVKNYPLTCAYQQGRYRAEMKAWHRMRYDYRSDDDDHSSVPYDFAPDWGGGYETDEDSYYSYTRFYEEGNRLYNTMKRFSFQRPGKPLPTIHEQDNEDVIEQKRVEEAKERFLQAAIDESQREFIPKFPRQLPFATRSDKKHVEDMIIFVLSLTQATEWVHVAIAFRNLITSFTDASLWETMMDSLCPTAIFAPDHQNHFENIFKTLVEIMDIKSFNWDRFYLSDLYKNTSQSVSYLAGFLLHAITGMWLTKEPIKLEGRDRISLALSIFQGFFQVILAGIRKFRGEDVFKTTENISQQVDDFLDTKVDVNPKLGMDPIEYLRALKDLQITVASYGASSKNILLASVLSRRLDAKAVSVTNYIAEKPRREPIHIALEGPPGSGKSTLVKMLNQLFCTRYGLDMDTCIGSTNATKYQGKINAMSRGIVIDDPNFHEYKEAADGPPGLFGQIINTAPCQLAQAEVERKSECIRPLWVISTHNNLSQNWSKMGSNIEAVKRRFRRYFKVRTLIPFVGNDDQISNMLKNKEHDKLWEFKLFVFDNESKSHKFHSIMNYSQAFLYVDSVVTADMRMADLYDSVDDLPTCSCHGLLKCPQQVQVPIVPTMDRAVWNVNNLSSFFKRDWMYWTTDTPIVRDARSTVAAMFGTIVCFAVFPFLNLITTSWLTISVLAYLGHYWTEARRNFLYQLIWLKDVRNPQVLLAWLGLSDPRLLKIAKFAIIALGVGTPSMILFGVYKFMNRKKDEPLKQTVRQEWNSNAREYVTGIESQYLPSTKTMNFVERVRKSVVRIKVFRREPEWKGSALGLVVGQLLIVNSHCLPRDFVLHPVTLTVYSEFSAGETVMVFNDTNCLRDASSDLLYVRLDIPTAKWDWMLLEDLPTLDAYKVKGSYCQRDGKIHFNEGGEAWKPPIKGWQENTQLIVGCVDTCYKVNKANYEGDSGGPLIVELPGGGFSILGLACCAHPKGWSYYALLSKKTVRIAIEHLRCSKMPLIVTMNLTTELHDSNLFAIIPSTYLCLGQLDPCYRDSVKMTAHKNKLSVYFQQYLKRDFGPRMLVDKTTTPWTTPIVKELRKSIQFQETNISDDEFKMAFTLIMQKVVPIVKGVSWDQAINGYLTMQPINLKKSAGPSFPGHKGRYFDGLKPYLAMKPDLERRINDSLRNLLTHQETSFIVKASIKDEVGPIDKMARIFKGGDLDTYLIARKYLGPIYIALRANETIGSYVGINAGSKEGGERLARFMIPREGYKSADFDFSSFDLRHTQRVIVLLFDAWAQFAKHSLEYSDDSCEIIKSYGELIANCVCIMDGSVSILRGTLVSGAFMTEYINTLLNLAYQIVAYKHLVGTWDFYENIIPGVYGDDGGNQVSDRVSGLYNPESIAKCMRKFNQDITSGSKTGKFDWCDDGLIFLRRRLRWDDDLKGYLAGLEIESILKSLVWSLHSDVPDSIVCCDILQSAVSEFFLRGKEDYETWLPRLTQAWEEVLPPSLKERQRMPSYQELVTRWKGVGLASLDL